MRSTVDTVGCINFETQINNGYSSTAEYDKHDTHDNSVKYITLQDTAQPVSACYIHTEQCSTDKYERFCQVPHESLYTMQRYTLARPC